MLELKRNSFDKVTSPSSTCRKSTTKILTRKQKSSLTQSLLDENQKNPTASVIASETFKNKCLKPKILQEQSAIWNMAHSKTITRFANERFKNFPTKHVIEENSIKNEQKVLNASSHLENVNMEGELSRPTLGEQLSFESNGGIDSTSPGSHNEQSAEVGSQTENLDQYSGEDIPLKNIRNFSIIAHVDHGKSTLADRLLEMTGTMKANPENKQVLDRLQVERERGITVKAQTASLFYQYKGEQYLLNLIDTPGHVDFSNEVSRSLAACQGVILLVDANQGVQAQTVANFYLASNQGLTVLPVLNKIDLKNADPEGVKDQLFNLFTIDPDDVLLISAKVGTGVEAVLKALISRVPPPAGDRAAPLRALVFDSWYDRYRGAIALVYIRDGMVKIGNNISSLHSKQHYVVRELGVLRPHEQPTDMLVGGQVGYMVCNMRSVSEAHIGDTLHLKGSITEPLAGFSAAQPMVYAGVYPLDQSQHVTVRNAIEKLALNDPAVTVKVDSSPALGQGWRVGFLGLLHLEVFNQRLDQEYGAEAVMTAPSVPYRVKITGKKNISLYGGEEITISDPSKLPDPSIITEISEPLVLGTIISPEEYTFKIIAECMERRGVHKSSLNIDGTRVMLQFLLPLNEIIVDFHDNLKSITSGFASFDYEDHGYAASPMVKLDILLNGAVVDALSTIVHVSKAKTVGKKMCAKLVEIIPRQMVHITIQASVGKNVVARENIKAFRKDVTAKLYGGDVTRRMKLLKQQSDGKKKMRKVANIDVPRDTFIDVLKR